MEKLQKINEIEEYEESQRKFRELWDKKRETPNYLKSPTQSPCELLEVRQRKLKNAFETQEEFEIVPGGRKWKKCDEPEMKDEAIAEIISSQAEVIMGTTLGINFLKFQKPEKDLSFLKQSETYRTVHHIAPIENGIEKRPAMVASADDILKCSSPKPFGQRCS